MTDHYFHHEVQKWLPRVLREVVFTYLWHAPYKAKEVCDNFVVPTRDIKPICESYYPYGEPVANGLYSHKFVRNHCCGLDYICGLSFQGEGQVPINVEVVIAGQSRVYGLQKDDTSNFYHLRRECYPTMPFFYLCGAFSIYACIDFIFSEPLPTTLCVWVCGGFIQNVKSFDHCLDRRRGFDYTGGVVTLLTEH